MGSISFIGTHTKKIIKHFKKYGLDVTIKNVKWVFDSVKNNNIKKIPILQKSGVYKLKCLFCIRGENSRMTNSLYARHFLKENRKFTNPLEKYEIINVVNNTNERKLREE